MLKEIGVNKKYIYAYVCYFFTNKFYIKEYIYKYIQNNIYIYVYRNRIKSFLRKSIIERKNAWYRLKKIKNISIVICKRILYKTC